MIMLKGRRIKMQISSRFTMAIHMFACIDTFTDQKMTSDFMAASIGTNPVIVRKLLQQLKAAGLIEVSRGTGGVTVTKPLNEITFLDIYKAVECTPDEELFHFHENPNQACPVGKNIHHVFWTISWRKYRKPWRENWLPLRWQM